MMKKNKLYTVNKRNKEYLGEAVEKAVPSPTGNLFWGGGDVAKWDRLASQAYGANYGDSGFTLDDYMNSKNAFGISKQNNPFSKGNIQGSLGVGAVGAVGDLGYNLISDDYRVGGTAGTIMDAAQKVKTGVPWIDLSKDAAFAITNRLFGEKVDQEKLDRANAGTAALNNFVSNARDFSGIKGPEAVANVENAYKGGLFKKSSAREKNDALKRQRAAAMAFADRSVENNIYNIAEDQLNDALANYAAFGGPLDYTGNDMGAIEYDFMDRYLTAKEAQNKQKNKLTGVGQLPTFMPSANTFEGGGKKNKAVKKVQEVVYDALAIPIHAVFGTPGKKRVYSGGVFPGAGASRKWNNNLAYSYNEIHPADTLFVPVTQTFNDAFADARRRGLDTFEFNGGTYGTELGDNPNWKVAGDARTRDAVIPVPIPADTIRRTSDVPRNDTIITDDAYRRYPISTSNIRETIPTGFALGGVLQNHGADWSTGLTHVNAGGTHSENPNDGVQMGVDPEGVPNLVEEGEVVWNDYVFSNRIELDEESKKMFHFPKKAKLTYADAAKKLEKEIQERPNDAVSQAGFNAQMQKLEEQQERQKAEMEAERAEAAFEALSPEEKVAIMQQAQQQEQAAQEAAMQEQTNMPATQPEMPSEMPMQGSPEEMAMQEQVAGQEVPVMAEGGPLSQSGQLTKGEDGYERIYAKGDKMNQKRNVGTWKNDKENHWDVFTKPGLQKYLENLKARIAAAPDDAAKDAIRREAMNELNGLQQSYFSHVLPTVGSSRYSYSDDILNHQKLFDRLYGNTGFYSTDANGNVRNLIAEAINLPSGAATEDKPDNWFDGYSGPRTSIRNFGSTQYGDDAYYKDLVDEFAKLGLTYAPNDNWKYGDYQLYGLSLPEEEKAAATPRVWDATQGTWVAPVEETKPYNADNLYGAPWAGGANGTDRSNGSNGTDVTGTGGKDDLEVEPNYRAEWPRYMGLFGPAVGLGLWAAGVGKPDYSRMDAALAQAARSYHLANNKYLGNYMRYKPMDTWFNQAKIDAQARATDRNILNTSGGNRGTAVAGLLANGLNAQRASGENLRQDTLYNRNDEFKTEEFNRGTDEFNAKAYNDLSRFNTSEANRAAQFIAQMNMQAARDKADLDAGWYNSLYGNIGGLFKGLGDLGRENAQHNMIAEMAADGLFGTMSPRTHVGRKGKYLTWKKKS